MVVIAAVADVVRVVDEGQFRRLGVTEVFVCRMPWFLFGYPAFR